MTRYVPAHESQYGADRSARTRASGCTWTSGAIGIDASTGGRIDPEPDQVLAKVKVSEETNPVTPGWSLIDLKLACDRFRVPFTIRTGAGWGAVKAARAAGLYIVLQGDSDRFPDGCSGQFDGDHAIGLPPDVVNPEGEWGIHDPICPRLTYQPESRLRAYAEKFSPGVAFGHFADPVPLIEEPDTVPINLAKLTYQRGVRMAEGRGIRRRPDSSVDGNVIRNTTKGELLPLVGNTGTGWQAIALGDVVAYVANDAVSAYVDIPPTPVPYPVKLSLTVGDKPVSVTTGPLTLP